MATLRLGAFLAANIRTLRLAQGLSQEKLAEKAHLDVKTVRGAETQKTDPNLSSIERIADALQVKTAKLFEPARPVKPRRGRPRKAKK